MRQRNRQNRTGRQDQSNNLRKARLLAQKQHCHGNRDSWIGRDESTADREQTGLKCERHGAIGDDIERPPTMSASKNAFLGGRASCLEATATRTIAIGAAPLAAMRGHNPVPSGIWSVKIKLSATPTPVPTVSLAIRAVNGRVAGSGSCGYRLTRRTAMMASPTPMNDPVLNCSPRKSPTSTGSTVTMTAVSGETTFIGQCAMAE